MKPKKLSLMISILLLAATALFAQRAQAATVNLIRTEDRRVYETVIMPWLSDEFQLRTWTADNGARVDRTLMRSYLLNHERLDGQSRYSVHIEYSVSISEGGRVIADGLKGQEIVFFIENGRVTGYFPFNEYWIRGGTEDHALASSRL